MRTGLVFDIRKFALHDGPGIRTAVFLKGCPLRCRWCHNPEGLEGSPELIRRPERCLGGEAGGCGRCRKACPLGLEPARVAGGEACRDCPSFGSCADACPAQAIQLAGRSMGVDELMSVLREDRAFYDESGGGATFTGGEPLAQGPFLAAMLDACRSEEIRSAVDTSGFASESAFVDAAMRADLMLVDLKLLDPERHLAVTRVPLAPILANLRTLARLRAARPRVAQLLVSSSSNAMGEAIPEGRVANVVLRLPIIPGVNDLPGDLEAAADFAAELRSASGEAWPLQLLPYHDSARGKYRLRFLDFPLEGVRPPDGERMSRAVAVFASRGIDATIGG